MKEPVNLKKLKLLHEPSADFEYRHDVFLVGGMANGLSLFDLALYYKSSADLLLNIALEQKDLSYEHSYPVVFLYRHSLELGLKAIHPKRYNKHHLDVLIKNFDEIITDRFNEKIPPHFKRWMIELSRIDPNSIGFRYGDVRGGEYIISYHDLKDIMDEIFRVLQIIRRELRIN